MEADGWHFKRSRMRPQQPAPATAHVPGLWDDDDDDGGVPQRSHSAAGLRDTLLTMQPTAAVVAAHDDFWDSSPPSHTVAGGAAAPGGLGSWRGRDEVVAAAGSCSEPHGWASQLHGTGASTWAGAGSSQPGDQEGDESAGSDTDQAAADEQEEAEQVEFAAADFDASSQEVVQRIEQLAASLVAAAAGGRLPQLTCVSHTSSNVHLAPSRATHTAGRLAAGARGSEALLVDDGDGADADDGDDSNAGAGTGGAAHVLRLGSKMCTRTLTAHQGAQANSVVRVLQLLEAVHALLRSGRTATQRDIYYSLVGRPGFSRPRDVTSAIQAALGLLRVPRSALGISAASKGAVAGCLLLRARAGEAWVDCRSAGPSGRPIPGEVGAVDALALRPAGSPRFILVVEKDAVFQGLVEARLHESTPCILVTGRGMPDVASRALVAALVRASAGWGADDGAIASSQPLLAQAAALQLGSGASQWPQQHLQQQQQQHLQQQQQQLLLRGGRRQALPVLGLVDWNPGGLAILLTYKCGSAALGLESARHAVPSLGWLGVTADMLQEARVPTERCHALTARDRAQVASLRARLAAAGCEPGWAAELDEMSASGLKADIEALPHEALMCQLQRRLLQRQWLA